MTVAILERTPIIRNQSMMALFSMPDDQLQSHEAWEYFCLRSQEELQLLQNHFPQQCRNQHSETKAKWNKNSLHTLMQTYH